jgi:hypothetical protein
MFNWFHVFFFKESGKTLFISFGIGILCFKQILVLFIDCLLVIFNPAFSLVFAFYVTL